MELSHDTDVLSKAFMGHHPAVTVMKIPRGCIPRAVRRGKVFARVTVKFVLFPCDPYVKIPLLVP